jgi:hypothetical protein
MKFKATLAITIMFTLSLGALGRHDERYMISIKRFPDWVKPPIEIVGLKVRGRTVESGVRFAADPDYFRGLSVLVKNTSNRRIVCVEAAIEFAPDGAGNPWLAELDLGAGADYQMSLNPDAAEINLQPGETVELKVAEETLKGLDYDVQTIKGLPTAILRTVDIRTVAAFFGRDEMWRGADYFKRDPNDYTRWKVATPGELQIQRRVAIGGFRMQKAAFKSAAFGCGFTVASEVQVCTSPCADCTVVHTCTRSESPGLRIVNRQKRCRKQINGEFVNCACTNLVTEVDTAPCN